MAKVKKEFKAGDKVIWFRPSGFDPREPIIGWVCGDPCVMGSRVRLTAHERDWEDGYGILDSQDYAYPFSTKFWKYCMAWMDRKAELYAELNKLQKGKF